MKLNKEKEIVSINSIPYIKDRIDYLEKNKETFVWWRDLLKRRILEKVDPNEIEEYKKEFEASIEIVEEYEKLIKSIRGN